MPRDVLKYGGLACFFFGATLAQVVYWRTAFDAAMALALLSCGLIAAGLALIAYDEDRRGRR